VYSGQMRSAFDEKCLEEKGKYYFTVRAKGTGRFEDSAIAKSEVWDNTDGSGSSGPVTDIYVWPTVEPDSAENIENLRYTLIATPSSSVAASIENDPESLAKFAKLELAYCKAGNYRVTVNVTPKAVQQGMTGDVTIDGAGLNAEGTAGGDVTFTVDAAAAQTLPEGYGNAVFVDMKLDGVTTNADNTLKIPVYVTVPVPAQMTQPENLTILHYDENGAYETITPTITQTASGQWTAAFALTHFSTFALAEPARLKGDVNEDGSITAADMQRIYAHMNGSNPF